jgi:hypothetical protein
MSKAIFTIFHPKSSLKNQKNQILKFLFTKIMQNSENSNIFKITSSYRAKKAN